MIKLLIAIAGAAALTAIATAQSDPRPAAAKRQVPEAQKNELASTRWFVDAFPKKELKKAAKKDLDDEAFDDDADVPAMELALKFDEKGQAFLDAGKLAFHPAPFTSKSERGVCHVNVVFSSAKHGEKVCAAVIRKDQLEGTLSWKQDGKLAEYTIRGCRATPLDDTVWKVTVTPQRIAADDEVDDPYPETIEFRRGKLCVRETDDTVLYLEPAAYQLVTTGGKSAVSTGPAKDNTDGVVWQLEVKGDTLTGAMKQESDGELVGKYLIQGKKLPPPARRARK